ncbi:hypothetical protein ACFQ7F_25390 [Streptomyces sp. NPDC056486]|uniref:hypothetical protein n=1 Tax=Streptomyces sp. NPDC056486 TaxID=3345835 RepID=UPI00369FEB98
MAQRMPHRAAAPRMPPVARRPRPAEPQIPVFIDHSGWRRRMLQGMALVVGVACLGYLVFVGTLISGLQQSVGTQPPSTNAPAPSGPDAGQPPAGRSAPPPAGGLKQ